MYKKVRFLYTSAFICLLFEENYTLTIRPIKDIHSWWRWNQKRAPELLFKSGAIGPAVGGRKVILKWCPIRGKAASAWSYQVFAKLNKLTTKWLAEAKGNATKWLCAAVRQ